MSRYYDPGVNHNPWKVTVGQAWRAHIHTPQNEENNLVVVVPPPPDLLLANQMLHWLQENRNKSGCCEQKDKFAQPLHDTFQSCSNARTEVTEKSSVEESSSIRFCIRPWIQCLLIRNNSSGGASTWLNSSDRLSRISGRTGATWDNWSRLTIIVTIDRCYSCIAMLSVNSWLTRVACRKWKHSLLRQQEWVKNPKGIVISLQLHSVLVIQNPCCAIIHPRKMM